MPLEHCSDATPVNAEVAVHVKARNSRTKDNHQFTILAKQESSAKDIQIVLFKHIQMKQRNMQKLNLQR